MTTPERSDTLENDEPGSSKTNRRRIVGRVGDEFEYESGEADHIVVVQNSKKVVISLVEKQQKRYHPK